jgi:hypothetical protein
MIPRSAIVGSATKGGLGDGSPLQVVLPQLLILPLTMTASH